jgi:GNAT superfamily N-acetyltransferase
MTTDRRACPTTPRAQGRRADPRRPQPALRIRTVKAADMPAVVALDATVTGLHKAAYWQRVYRRYGINGQGQRHFLVAECSNDRVCGFVIGEVRDWEFGAPPCGWLFAIDVVPSARQQGVGGRLLAELAAALPPRGRAHPAHHDGQRQLADPVVLPQPGHARRPPAAAGNGHRGRGRSRRRHGPQGAPMKLQKKHPAGAVQRA